MTERERVYSDAEIEIDVLRGLGSMGNNSYLLQPAGGGPVTIVDVPEGSEAILEALAGLEVARVVLTHGHRDHWAGHEVVRARFAAPFFAGPGETGLEAVAAGGEVVTLEDNSEFEVGACRVRVLRTPGHTPGSICLLANGALLTGDTLFPGGPGYSRDHTALLREILSITGRLFVLPGETLVLPGHGDGTTIGVSKAEHAVFASAEHAPDLRGDVLWLTS